MKQHPTAIVAAGAQIADDVEIGPYCIIGDHVQLASGCKLLSHVVIEGHTRIGQDCTIYPFAILGAPPQHLGYKGEPTRLVIGDRNIIREHSTMHLGTPVGRYETVVGNDGFFMADSHIGHDSVVGDHCILTKGGTLAGHVTLGDYAIIGGVAAVHQFTRIGRHAMVGGLAAVTRDVIPFGSVWGNHAHLEGLNLVGLKRRGFGRETINAMRAAYRMLFANEGTFQERIEDTAQSYGHIAEVVEILDFIREDADRPMCLPHRDV
jgi:UDP-N-acetylglucosamine acyltransferase